MSDYKDTTMKRIPLTGVLLTLLILVVSAPRGAAANHGMDFQKMQPAMQELAQKSGTDFDIAYINSIVPHHQAAIAMAQMVQSDAPHQEVRDAATKMIQDQQKEISDLTTWMSTFYNQQVAPDPRMQMSATMMDQMRQADATMREKMFLAMMREHHQVAIDMGNMALQKATRAELKDQAQMMITMQKQEQDQFGAWLRTWYNVTAPTPTGDMQHGMDAAMAAPMPSNLPATGLADSMTWWVAALSLGVVLFLAGALVRRRAS